jgi:hypothetical protein
MRVVWLPLLGSASENFNFPLLVAAKIDAL